MDTLDGMRAFARVVENGSFTGGARALGLSTALASKYVRQLEDRLGARLLNRTTRSVQPTEVGQAYYERCQRLLLEFDDLEESIGEQQGMPRGLLRVAGPRAFGEDMMVSAVGSFLDTYPDISVELQLDERMVDIVTEGYDVAVRVGELPDSSLIARHIAMYPYYICAAPAYLQAHGTPQTPEELVGHRCVVNAAISPTNQWQFVMNGKKSQIAVPAQAKVNTARAVATLVRAGQGIGLCLHSTVSDDLESGRLVRLLRKFEAYDRNVYAVYPHSLHLSAKVRVFVDHLLETYAAYR